MTQRVRYFAVLIIILIVVSAVVLTGQNSVASFSGTAQINGPVQLDLRVSPPISAPGTPLTLNVMVSNQMLATIMPEVVLRLPPGLSTDVSALPAGATMNMRRREISWFPVLPANGGMQQFGLQLRVEAADVAHPEKQIEVILKYDDFEQQAVTDVWVGVAPQIRNIQVLPQVSVGELVSLQADVDGSGPFALTWYVGDGRRIDVNQPAISYPTAGVYQITVEATNPLMTVSQSKQIVVVPLPIAKFTLDDLSLGVGQQFAIINQSGGQPPLQYSWDFGDGTTSNEPNPTHQYNTPGAYQIRLVVENDFDKQETAVTAIVANPVNVQISLPESVPAGQLFTAQAASDGDVQLYTWDMGDGRLLEGAQVSHTYTQMGNVYVRLVAQGDYGSAEVGQWIYVGEGSLSNYLPLIVRDDGVATAVDPFALNLEPVELDAPFVMQPIDIPAGTSPAEQLLIYINEARRQFDLSPLNSVYELSLAAQHHADDMATYAYTGHTGTDGSHPLERFIQHGYPAAYAGEATAWGFEHPYQAVEFWVNSPAHRRIILNKYATDVGVGYTVKYDAPNIWYWTSEFGNGLRAAEAPFIRLQPLVLRTAPLFTEAVTYRWNWPLVLAPDQQFVVYLRTNGQDLPVATINMPVLDTLYTAQVIASDHRIYEEGTYEWFVALETFDGDLLAYSPTNLVTLADDPDFVPPTPVVIATATPPPSPTPLPTAVPSPTQIPVVTATPPASPTPVPIVTATPIPITIGE